MVSEVLPKPTKLWYPVDKFRSNSRHQRPHPLKPRQKKSSASSPNQPQTLPIRVSQSNLKSAPISETSRGLENIINSVHAAAIQAAQMTEKKLSMPLALFTICEKLAALFLDLLPWSVMWVWQLTMNRTPGFWFIWGPPSFSSKTFKLKSTQPTRCSIHLFLTALSHYSSWVCWEFFLWRSWLERSFITSWRLRHFCQEFGYYSAWYWWADTWQDGVCQRQSQVDFESIKFLQSCMKSSQWGALEGVSLIIVCPTLCWSNLVLANVHSELYVPTPCKKNDIKNVQINLSCLG